MKHVTMILSTILIIMAGVVPAIATTDYMLYEHHGGIWSDAEKSSDNFEDDLMCWAAAASNVLEWTGWGKVSGMTNTDQMFNYFQDHWTDNGGLMKYGWDWWFDGTNNSQGRPGCSQVDVPGGGFYPSKNFYDYYHETWDDLEAMSAIEDYLHAGYGTAIGIYGPGGHAITVWGYKYGSTVDDYIGIWVVDSDDDKFGSAPRPDSLRYYDVAELGGKWYLQDYYGSNAWYIGRVDGLESVPEPTTLLLLGLGGIMVRRKQRKWAVLQFTGPRCFSHTLERKEKCYS